jgi:GTPase SAR1 family protein
MAADPTLVLDIPAAITETIERSRSARRPLDLARPALFPVALVGPPGAGKTTIVRALHGGQVPRDGLVPEWHVKLVEYPGLEQAADLRRESYAQLWRDPVGILYVLPSRGLNDQDEQALEMLRPRRVVVLENIRDSELHPARTSVTLLERPEIGCPFTMPLVPLMRHHSVTEMAPAEYRLVRQCVAYLRHATLPDTVLRALHRQAMAARVGLRADIDGQWARVLTLARDPADLARLDGLRRLLALRDDCTASGPYDAQLTELIRLVELSAAADATLLARLRDAAQGAADRYNIEAGRRPLPGVEGRAGGRGKPGAADHDDEEIDFGAHYVEERRQLHGFLKNVLAQRSQLGLLDEEHDSLARLVRKVEEDNIDLALLGRFSSGKSSIINALLGVPIDDRNPRLLPTDVRPETATVNRVCHGADEAVKVEWLTQAELTFATPTSEPGQLRLHGDEIRAFHDWLSAGQVKPRDVSFIPLPEEFRDPDSPELPQAGHQLAAFHQAWRDLGFPDNAKKFVYAAHDPRRPKLPDLRFPRSATIQRLPAVVGRLRHDIPREEIFPAIKADAALALLIDRLNIRFDHPLLRHASFIDTPGTDAPIPHHRRVAQQIIRQQNCPVIYCFLGVRPGGNEDRQNLKVLQEWGIGSTNLNRFFFVITMKKNVEDAEERETIRAHLRSLLREIGITAPTLYFVDVVYYPDDDEFRTLKADVERFITDSKSELFGSWLGQARAVVGEAHARGLRKLDILAEGEHQRGQRVKHLKSQLARLDTITEDYRNSSRWGAPWTRDRVERNIGDKAGQVDQIIDALTSRSVFDGVESRLSDALIELNRSTRSAITSAHSGLLGKLQSSVAEVHPAASIQVTSITIDSDPFPSTEILEATGRLYWRNIIKRLWQRVASSTEMNADVTQNRGRIAGPWRQSRDRGTATARALISASIEEMAAELKRISASVKAELDAVAKPPSRPEDKDMLEKACALASEWLSRLDALGRQAKQAGGSR